MRNKKMRNTKAAGIVLALVLTISNVYPVMATSAAGGKMQEQVQSGKKEGKVIFLDTKAGKDEADGASEKNAVKSLDQALKLTGEKGRIILCGETKLDEAEKTKIPAGIQVQTLKNYQDSLVVTTPEATPTPEAAATPEVTPTPEVTAAPEATPTPEATVTPTPEVTVTPTPEVTVTPTPQITPQPGVTPTPEPTAGPEDMEIPEESPIVSDNNTEGQQEKDKQQDGGLEEESTEDKKQENETKVSDIEDQQVEEKKMMALSANVAYESENEGDETSSVDTEEERTAKAAETAKEDQLSALATAANTAGSGKRSIGSILVGNTDDFYQSASAGNSTGNNNNSSNKGNTSSGGGSSTSGNGTKSSNKGSNSGSSTTKKSTSGSTAKKVTTQTPSRTSGRSRAYVKTGDTNQVLPLTVSSVMALLMGVSLAGMKMERKRNCMRAQAAEEWNTFHEACRF